MGLSWPSRWGARLEQFWYRQRDPSIFWVLFGAMLAGASWVFRFVVAIKNQCYNAGILNAQRIVGTRVISVGNLVVGGAGKTPVVIFLARKLLHVGKRVAVVSRGYGRHSRKDVIAHAKGPTASELGDEPALILEKCKGSLVLVGKNKLNLTRTAQQMGAEFVILDDGMQQRRIARDLDIVVIDAKAQMGNGHLLPWGPLREPLASLSRADLVWNNGEHDPKAVLGRPAVWAEYIPVSVRDEEDTERPLNVLRGRRVLVVCGIARPERFVEGVTELGAAITGVKAFPDHHWFSEREISEIRGLATDTDAVIVTTEKDAIRLPPDFKVWKLVMDLRIVAGEHLLERALGFS